MAAVFPVILLVAMVFALIDIIIRDEWQVRHLPKFGWILLVIFLPLVGTLLWFVIGRGYGGSSATEGIGSLMPQRSGQGSRPQLPQPPQPPQLGTTEQQLADLDREIEYYQRRADLERLKREADSGSAGER